MIFGEIAAERLPIRAFYPAESGIEDYRTRYLDGLESAYRGKVDKWISKLAEIQSQFTKPDLPTSTSPNRSISASLTTSPKESRTLKRTHSRASLNTATDENRSPRRASETKALKNAKLLKALRDVEKTLGSMEVEEQQRVNEVF